MADIYRLPAGTRQVTASTSGLGWGWTSAVPIPSPRATALAGGGVLGFEQLAAGERGVVEQPGPPCGQALEGLASDFAPVGVWQVRGSLRRSAALPRCRVEQLVVGDADDVDVFDEVGGCVDAVGAVGEPASALGGEVEPEPAGQQPGPHLDLVGGDDGEPGGRRVGDVPVEGGVGDVAGELGDERVGAGEHGAVLGAVR